MILQHATFCGAPSPSQICSPVNQWRKQTNLLVHHQLQLPRLRDTRSSSFKITSFGPGLLDAVAQLASNKVLIAAVGSALVGQLVKPLTSVFLYGKKFDIKSVIDTGGFPSTHSSATVASATLLALERGFSDPIFGLTFVYAGLIMYDAQGVRKEVGSHAKLLNKLILQMQLNSVIRPQNRDGNLMTSRQAASTPLNDTPLLSQSEEGSALDPTLRNAHISVKPNKTITQIDGKPSSSSLPLSLSSSGLSEADASELYRLVGKDGLIPLKESVGHTSFEVFGGAVFGLLAGFVVHNFLR